MGRFTMYRRMVTRALIKRKARVAIALAALIIGTGVISGLLSVYYDINIKMSKELRSYGANFILVPAEHETLSDEKIQQVINQYSKDKVVGFSPYLYGIGMVDKRKLVIVGTNLDQIEKVTPYWQITGQSKFSKDDAESVIIGTNVAVKMDLKVGKEITVKADSTGLAKKFIIKGIVRTGSTEDNQVFLNLPVVQSLFKSPDKANIVYLSLLGKSDELSTQAGKVNQTLKGAELKPIKQISKSEGIILEKIKSLVYLVVLVILLSTFLCVSTTMMTMVIERRKEIGLRKALGAQNKSIILEFLGEGFTLGALGGFLGAMLGLGLAQIIGQSVFKSYISLRIEVIMMVTFMALVVASIASILPVRMATNVEPALTLKGE